MQGGIEVRGSRPGRVVAGPGQATRCVPSRSIFDHPEGFCCLRGIIFFAEAEGCGAIANSVALLPIAPAPQIAKNPKLEERSWSRRRRPALTSFA